MEIGNHILDPLEGNAKEDYCFSSKTKNTENVEEKSYSLNKKGKK